jgi:hypothetical protein
MIKKNISQHNAILLTVIILTLKVVVLHSGERSEAYIQAAAADPYFALQAMSIPFRYMWTIQHRQD